MNKVFAAASLIPRTCVRRLSATQVNSGKADLSKIKKKQMHFQMDNDVPVYLKGGPTDYVLFFTTVGLIVAGLSASLSSIYKLATKK